MIFNAAGIFQKFVPREFHPLLQCISPSAFKVVDWQGLVSEAPLLTRRFVQKIGVAELKKSLQPLLPERVELQDFLGAHRVPIVSEAGDALLELYFLQIFNSQGIFLDLRSQNFAQLPQGKIGWAPNGLWVQWREPFRYGLLKIYQGYYGHQPSQLRQGLLEVGLIRQDFSAEKVQQVESMLLQHIGGQADSQSFAVEHFTASFERLFRFLLQNQIRLSTDFLYLGVYLASLYLHLEKLGGAYSVRAAFERAQSKSLNDKPMPS